MRATLVAVALILIPAAGFAQSVSKHSYGYGFVAPVYVPDSPFTRWRGTFVQLGAGGEWGVGDHVGIGAEGSVLKPATNMFGVTSGLFSVGASYHPGGIGNKLDPFVGGGGAALVGSGYAGLWHLGGGVNYWAREHLGLRVEIRYHHWPHGDGPVKFTGFRFGVTFR